MPKLKPTICTASGVEFHFLAPKPGSILLEDIAHALSHTPRFGGHTHTFYSVAQHCCWVSDRAAEKGSDRDAAVGLFHDAAEAYLCDMPSPVKAVLPEFEAIEARLLRAIYRAFGIGYDVGTLKTPVVEHFDDLSWRVERASFMPDADWWPPERIGRIPLSGIWQPAEARYQFMERAHRLAAEGAITLSSENCRHA